MPSPLPAERVATSVALFASRWQTLHCESRARQTLYDLDDASQYEVPAQAGKSINVCSHCSQRYPDYLFFPNMTAVVWSVWKGKCCMDSQIFNLQSGPQRCLVHNQIWGLRQRGGQDTTWIDWLNCCIFLSTNQKPKVHNWKVLKTCSVGI